MNKIAKFFGMFFTFACLFFCFAGCTVFPTGSGSDPSTGNDDRVNSNDDSNKGDGSLPLPDISDSEDIYSEDYFSGYQELYYGARAVYKPYTQDYYSNVSNQQLGTDREYMNVAIANQYYVISGYIIYQLIGEYGVDTVDNWSYTLNIYADESYLPAGNYGLTFLSDAKSPTVVNADILHTNAGAIERSIDGVAVDADGLDYQFVPAYNEENAWTCSLGSGHLADADYKNQYMTKFVPYLQLRLMELNLGLVGTTLSTYNSMSSDAVTELIMSYANQMTGLGIDCSTTNQLRVVSLIESEIIGYSAMSREYADLTLHERFSWEYDSGGDLLLGTATIDLNGDGEYDDTILSSTLYKYDYDAVVSRIVAEIYSTAGMNMGEVPTYDRREIMDIDSVQFFDPGMQSDGTEPDRLTNMDYQEYQSVILYSRENSLPWFLSVSIDSVQALEIDLYIRINKNGTIYTHYLGTMHTDPNQNFSWAGDIPEGEDGSESDVDYNSLVANQQSWEIPTVLAEHLPDDTEDLPADLEQLMSEGVSTVNVDLLADAGEYYALMGYKLPIYSDYVSGPTNVSKGDTTADLSHLLVCGNTENDFLEIVFDVQHSSSSSNPDYRFKFLIEVIDLLSGTDEEETT